ncbi:peptide chain release factor N(5)-glutamine methyltransferase [Thioalkalivibrio sp. HK1]|uniref:peptide chain release factor N(5)-glutamine methyltransferase n=1 Tax=Thioalkalivibrio sp. HK1 TaxID=1469245 RepID=UPI0004B097D8|nr:peptide chain release factor N(5)-glutamine methyltransferase [Thioalkalivibrio sp. HK1]
MPDDTIARTLAEASTRLALARRPAAGRGIEGIAGSPDADRSATRPEAEILLGFVLGKSRTQLRMYPEAPLSPETLARFASLIGRRAEGEPIAYLTGRREFWSLDLMVSPDTLIPRPESEHLVEVALESIDPGESAQVADIGTGAGPVALAIASERERATVLATDRSLAALHIARKNARGLGIRNVSFALADSCAALKNAHWSMIVSNPPYIASDDPHLLAGDPSFEPRDALVAGSQGLDMLTRLARQAPARLVPGGRLALEHGWQQGEDVRRLLAENGFCEIETRCDLAGHERITSGRKRT